MNEWIKKAWCVYTTGHYLAIRKKKILSFEISWINTEHIISCEIGYRKTNIVLSHLYMESQKAKLIERL